MKPVYQHGPSSRPSLLERLARKIEPKPSESEPKSQGRLIKQMKDIPEAGDSYRPGEPAKPTNAIVTMKDGDPMRFHTDGSLRHAQGRIKGKAARKAFKKARRHMLRVTSK